MFCSLGVQLVLERRNRELALLGAAGLHAALTRGDGGKEERRGLLTGREGGQ